jgi:hypothetical protein
MGFLRLAAADGTAPSTRCVQLKSQRPRYCHRFQLLGTMSLDNKKARRIAPPGLLVEAGAEPQASVAGISVAVRSAWL